MTAHYDRDEVRDALNAQAETIAIRLLGTPNRDLSNSHELRWGTKGSLALNLDSGVRNGRRVVPGMWFDHEAQIGGDLLDLIERQHGGDFPAVLAFGAELAGVKPKAPNGKERPPSPRPVVVAPPPEPKHVAASPIEARTTPATFPLWTPPDERGKPKFIADPAEPAKYWTEIRRHVYERGGAEVLIKIKQKDGQAWLPFWRVRNAHGTTGWQAKKPADYLAVPYVGAVDPFDTELTQADRIYWTEGEKDADTLGSIHAPAFTFGGVGDGLPIGAEQFVKDRHVVILSHNDPQAENKTDGTLRYHPDGRPVLPGQNHAEHKAALCHQVAASVRVVHFRELPPKGDVTDWIAQGHSLKDLDKRADETPLWQPPMPAKADLEIPTSDPAPEATAPITDTATLPQPQKITIAATPYTWRDPTAIPRREWLFARHYVRGFVSATVAPGGVGKTTKAISEVIAMATGRDFLGETPADDLRVWYWNGEDPKDEIERRIAAECQHHGIDAAHELAGRLFVDSGHDMPIGLATAAAGSKVTFDEASIAAIIKTITNNRIDVMILDPFISCHSVPENDNGAIDKVLKRLGHVAEETRSAIEIIHHVRKPFQGQGELTVDDARGGGAIVNAVRSARVLNRMSEGEATKAGVNGVDRRAYFRTDKGKANMAPPEVATWARLVSVPLPNGDNVAAVEKWSYPSAFDGVTADDMHHVREKARTGNYRASSQATDWIGHVLAERLGLKIDIPANKTRIGRIIKMWLATGVLATEDRAGPNRKSRPFVVPGNWKDEPGGDDAPL